MIQKNVTVVVVGAGLSGICMGIKLRELHIDFVILEKNSQVSGTWTENRYPGCGCDIPMFAYCYSFEMFYGDAWPKQPEILAYFEHCVEKYGLVDSIKLNTRVESAIYAESDGKWTVTTNTNEQFSARFVVNATGQLNHLYTPDFPGLEHFEKPLFHSTKFPEDYSMEGKRLALVGGGASALQIVEALQGLVESIVVFSRSPKYVFPGVKYSPLTLNRMKQDPEYWQEVRERFIDAQDQYRVLLDDFPQFDPFDEYSKVKDFYAQSHSVDMDSFRIFYQWLDQRGMRPQYPTGCSRPLVSHTFHDAIRSHNVTLVSAPITRFSQDAIFTVDAEFKVDCAVLATGFSLNNLVPPYELTGVNGKKLSECWTEVPEAYLGIATTDFPNLFFLYGPNTNTNASSVTFFVESQVNYLGQIFSSYLAKPFKAIEIDKKTLMTYQGWLREKGKNVSEAASCSSWYKNTGGINISTFPGSTREYQQLTRDFVEAEYRISLMPDNVSERNENCNADQDMQSLLDKLVTIFSKTTLLAEDEINPHASLRDFGLDSILIVDFVKKLNAHWTIELQPAIFFEYETLAQLGKYLANTIHRDSSEEYCTTETTKENSSLQLNQPDISAEQIALWVNNRRKPEAEFATADKTGIPHHHPGGHSQDIAIIGAQGYFPEAKSLAEFWQNLYEEKCCIKEVPAERWGWEDFQGDPVEGNKSKSKWGGFLENVDLFDPQFFKINPKEASLMDPQHRLFLQCAWELIEESGYAPETLSGKKIGVIVGINLNDYAEIVQRVNINLDVMEMTGLMHLFVANRLSYLLGLTGPSEVIDTACSSSLIAVHRAVQALRQDNCEMMIVGGANLMLTPRMHILYSKAGMLCEDGRCKTFSQQANGYVRGEGVAAILLKPLAQAEKDGDSILGVIKGSAENHGGKANSLTAPNPNLQAELVANALRNADIDPRTIGYIECHGTGTRLGDPIEINGLIKAFTQIYKERGFEEIIPVSCALGSVKSNIGHLETAAGIAGLIKVLLSFKHKFIPATLFSEPHNSQINLQGTPFYINSSGKPWDTRVISGKVFPRRAGVSSFGAGGSNAHLVLEEYTIVEHHPSMGQAQIIVLSDRNTDNLRRSIELLLEYMQRERLSEYSLPSIAYTLQIGRKALAARAAFVVTSVEELIQRLRQWLNNESYAAGTVVQKSKPTQQGNASLESWMAKENFHELAAYWQQGGEISWDLFYKGGHPRRISLPARPFVKERFWVGASRTESASAAKNMDKTHAHKPKNIQLLSLNLRQSVFTQPKFNVEDRQIILGALDDRQKISSASQLLSISVREGVATICIDRSSNQLNADLVVILGETLERVAGITDLKVLVLKGNGENFLGGLATQVSGLHELYEKVSAFPYPIIAAVNGRALGSGFVVAALCDLMVCDISMCYGVGKFALSSTEQSILEERFGLERVNDFILQKQEWTGAALQALGWPSVFTLSSEFERTVDKLVAQFSNKSPKALNVLKMHLARPLLKLLRETDANNLAVSVPVSQGTSFELGNMVYPEFWIKPVLHQEGILELGLGAPGPRASIKDIVVYLSQTLDQVCDTDIRLVVLCSQHPGFLPFDQSAESQNLAFELALVLERFPLPVISVLDKGASDLAWFVALHSDACIYAEDASYQTGSVCMQDKFIQRFIVKLAASMGLVLTREMLLTNTRYRGSELVQRVPWLRTGPACGLLEHGLKLAGAWSEQARDKLVVRKQLQQSRTLAKINSLPVWQKTGHLSHKPEASFVNENDFIPLNLTSKVIKASSSNGIVVVRMEDKQARNMFSDAFVQGIKEVFAHVNGNQTYKVVILLGYDSYFASGGTREALLAIQQGKLNFTDSEVKIYQLAMECKIPVIAAMQGHGIGAGWSFGMFADLHIFSKESKYFSPYMKFHFTPGAGSTLVLPHHLGQDLARESLYTAFEFSGGDFAERALVQHVVPRTEVFAFALSMANMLNRFSRNDLIQLKRQFTENLLNQLDDTYERELAMHSVTFVGQNETLNQIQTEFGMETAARAETDLSTAKSDVKSLYQRSDNIGSLVKSLLAQELHMAIADIDERTNFVDLGLDSISGVTWIRKLNQQFNVALEATQVYAYPNLELLTKYLADITGYSSDESTHVNVARKNAVPENIVHATKPSSSAIAEELRALLSDELHMQIPHIDMQAQFVDMGLDSISGVTWIRRVNEKYSIHLEATIIYSYPTLAQLSQYLGRLLVVDKDTSTPEVKTLRNGIAEKPSSVLHPSTQNTTTETLDIAIIGMDGQFPGAGNLDYFWENIASGKNCITEVEQQRWDTARYFVPEKQQVGKTLSKWMGALENYRCFDPLFFNISPTEARAMDPQQRLFLQSCWLAIENSGYDPESLSGTRCAVFAGCGPGDYQQLSRAQRVSAHGFTGDAASILAARISYFLNLKGASISIDTACSSSLVALAMACDNLTSGNSDLALAGGVCVMATPEMHIMTSQAGMLSTKGRCATFDESADGIVLGEGVGVLVLKRVRDAERDGDCIQALIKGWGVNQDGKTNGITAPNPESQSALQKGVYDQFEIDASHIQYIETHGTGTPLGDPIEVSALKATFKDYTKATNYCALGSVKSNIGHTLMAAGVASTIKTVLAIKNQKLPPTINFRKLNSHINLEHSPFYINTELRDWKPSATNSRMAAISAFSFSGTNAHLVVAEYPRIQKKASGSASILDENIAILSARTPEQLQQKARDLHTFLQALRQGQDNNSQAEIFNKILFTLQTGRSAMNVRLALVVCNVQELEEKLNSFVRSEATTELFYGSVQDNKDLVNLLGQDETLSEGIVKHFIETRAFAKLAEFWVKGFDIDWTCLYQGFNPGRMELPGYPFAREICWINDADQIASSVELDKPDILSGKLHPLVHINSSNLHQQQFTSFFNGSEFFLRDHRVKFNGAAPVKTLPGVAYLEIIQAAYKLSCVDQLPQIMIISDLVWLRPFSIEGDSEQLTVALRVAGGNGAEGESVACEILSTQAGSTLVCCQGFIEGRFVAIERKQLEVARLKARMLDSNVDVANMYKQFTQMGLYYGDAHQAVKEVFVGEKEALAQLALPENLVSGASKYYLHPSMMDCAIQSCISLVWQKDGTSTTPLVPFSLEKLNVFSACTHDMFAWVRFSNMFESSGLEEYFDIDLCDVNGYLCIEIRGLTMRYVKHVADAQVNRSQSTRLPQARQRVFDTDYYSQLIDKLQSADLSVEQAVELS